MNVCMPKPVGYDKVNDQSDKPIQILATRDTRALAL